MNLIIPMAGMGKRLRPHTLTTPKPLIPVAGKPIVQRLVQDIAKVTPEKIEKVGFIVGHFGEEVESQLLDFAKSIGAIGQIIYQEKALGTAHAIYCAKELLDGKVSVAFADTLFRAEFTLDTNQDGIIWVKEIEDPSAFGVVKTNEEGIVTEFVEKSKEPISNKAIIGIYYFKVGEKLRDEIQHLIDHDIRGGGEFQLTMALESLKEKGMQFTTGTVQDWLDCGNKNVTVETNSRYLTFIKDEELILTSNIEGSEIIPPVYLGSGARIQNSVIGPGVSIGDNSIVKNSKVEHSLVQDDCVLEDVILSNSMLGNYVKVKNSKDELNLGDYSEIN
ncbi:MAG: nucleotidyltransferase [Cytophagales bacterium]|nr:nucleotidyltransferase [Cytophagales bacterium]